MSRMSKKEDNNPLLCGQTSTKIIAIKNVMHFQKQQSNISISTTWKIKGTKETRHFATRHSDIAVTTAFMALHAWPDKPKQEPKIQALIQAPLFFSIY